MSPLLRVASSAVVLLIAPASAEPGSPSVIPRVDVRPSIARLGERPTIAVSGIRVRSLEVRLAGGSYADGEPLPWHALTLVAGAWRGTLPAPALHGLYRVVLRTRPGAAPIGPQQVFLRVFPRGLRSAPSFGS